MAQLVTTVNGVKVFSDKSMTGIRNTRVSFADGSWCDVATGEVVNNGTGYLSIGAPGGAEDLEKITLGPWMFSGTMLDISNIDADVSVEPWDQAEISVEVTGPKSEAEAVKARESGSVVYVEGASSGSSGSSVRISGGGNSVISIGGMSVGSVVVGGSVHISSGGSDEMATTVSIKVPEGTAVKASGIQGTFTVGDVLGSLDLNSQGQGKSRIGKVTSASVSVQGQGEVRIAEINGNLTVQVMGQAKVRVQRGFAPTFNASVQGQGEVVFRGSAENATLSVMGQGEIDVDEVVNRPSQSVTGQGEINIGNW